jgi:hypothetical protein
MNIDEWWPKLDPSVQEWLIANNGDAVPPDILSQITAVSGDTGSDSPWAGDNGPDGFFLSDEATDWIEATANDESSAPS